MTKLNRLLLAGSFVLAAGAAQAMPVYDATAQFDMNNNPSVQGGWSYGYSTNLGGEFKLFTVTATPTMTVGSTVYTFFDWIEKSNDFTPDIEKNISGVDINAYLASLGITLVWPKDAITLGGDAQNGYNPVLRWTAPTAGEYFIDVTYTGVWDTTRSATYNSGSDVFVLVNGQTVFSDRILDLSSADFSKNFTLGQGDHVDFTLKHIPGIGFERSLVKATIAETTAVPEPASLALLGLGLAGLGLVRRRNSQKNKV